MRLAHEACANTWTRPPCQHVDSNDDGTITDTLDTRLGNTTCALGFSYDLVLSLGSRFSTPQSAPKLSATKPYHYCCHEY
jgi:hypothetical protein